MRQQARGHQQDKHGTSIDHHSYHSISLTEVLVAISKL
jgi:hypothetical protein